jgi:hypothetical protein
MPVPPDPLLARLYLNDRRKGADRLQLCSQSREFACDLSCETIQGIIGLIQKARRGTLYLENIGHQGRRYQGRNELPLRMAGREVPVVILLS